MVLLLRDTIVGEYRLLTGEARKELDILVSKDPKSSYNVLNEPNTSWHLF